MSHRPGSVEQPHIIHLLRTVQQNQLQLILMADQKANILIGGALIVLTVLGTQLLRQDVNPLLLILTASIVLAAVFAILAAKPRVVQSPTADSEHFNLLFFGHFDQLTQAEFIYRMENVLDDEAQSYRAMSRDIFQMGKVLENKYRYLAWSYRSFLAGLTFATLAFTVQYLRTGVL